jgi:hypothetical protein
MVNNNYTRAATSIGLGLGVDFTCSSDDSAILVLPDGANGSGLPRVARYLENLTNNMVSSWLDSQSVLLVTGCIKSCSWGVAAVSNKSKDHSLSLSFSAIKIQGALTGSYAWQSTSAGHHRDGPDPPSTVKNQCVFIMGYHVSMRKKHKFAKQKRKLVNAIDDSAPIPKARRSGVTSPGSGNVASGSGGSQDSHQRQGTSGNAEEQDAQDRDNFVVEALTDVLPVRIIFVFLNNYLTCVISARPSSMRHKRVLVEKGRSKSSRFSPHLITV